MKIKIAGVILLLMCCQLEGRQSNTSDSAINLEKVAKKFAQLLAGAQLPGLKKDVHGHSRVYQLTPELQKEGLKAGWLSKKMLRENKACPRPYFVWLETEKESKQYAYFFCSNVQTVELISAYRRDGGSWIQIPLAKTDKRPRADP